MEKENKINKGEKIARKIKIKSPITIIFSLICVVAFLLGNPNMFILGSGNVFGVFLWIFGHNGIEHLIGNLLPILIIGPVLESRYSKKTLISLITLTTLTTSILHLFLFQDSVTGASGILCMFAILTLMGKEDGEIPLMAVVFTFFVMVSQILSGAQMNGISEFSHIIGILMGFLFGLIIKRDKDYI